MIKHNFSKTQYATCQFLIKKNISVGILSRFELYPVYNKISLLSDNKTLKNKIFHPLGMTCVKTFGLYPAHKVCLITDATTLTFNPEKQYTSHHGEQM
jgi:hypothetical protein